MSGKAQTKQKENPILTYYQRIKDGTIVVGAWILRLYEYIVKGLETKAFVYDPKKANAAIDWIETHGFHTKGPLAPNAIKLELWQKALLACIYGLLDENGNRQFREVVLIVARKNGKSLFASAIGKYDWQVTGGFGASVMCIAPKLEQADIVYNDIWLQTQLDPEWQELKEQLSERDSHNKKLEDDSALPRHRQSDLYIPAMNAQVKKIAFSAKKSDGFNPSLCICDEIASWEGDNGLKQYEVMKSAMGARPEPLLLSCSTAGYINDGVYDEVVKRSTRFLLGESKEKRLLPFLYMIDDVEKWNDINELQKSNPNLGVSVTVDYLLEEIAIAEGSLSKKAEFLTKYCNVKQNSSLAWLSAQTVEGCFGAPLDLADFKSSYAVCGIDLSQTTDLTAATVVIEKGGELYVFAKFWLPAEKIDEAVAKVAEQLNADYASAENAPIFVGVLNGSYMFLADLVRKTTFNNEVTFVQISSYEGTQSTGTIKQKLGIDFDIEGRDIIVVEDIVETGHSINHMLNYIKSLNPHSVEVCTLFFKPDKYLYDLPIKYCAMEIGNEFIVGYGLDYDQLGRNLKDIYVLAND